MKRSFVGLLTLLQISVACAQSWEDIQTNPDIIYGEGYGSTIEEADRNALSNLISKIVVHVSSDFEIVEDEHSEGGNIDSKSYVSSRVRTYSQATLNNTEQTIISGAPKAIVARWMKRSELYRIFAAREAKAKDMVDNALQAVEHGKVDDALCNFYWAYLLLRSLQHPNEVSYVDEYGKSHILMNWIPDQMNAIFDDVQFKVHKRNGDDVDLRITYNSRPVSSISFSYFDGREWLPSRGGDGEGVMELASGYQSDYYQLKIEYEFRNRSVIDKEVASVLEFAKADTWPKAPKKIKATATKGMKVDERTFAKTDAMQISKPKTIKQKVSYEKIIQQIIKSIREKDVASIRDYFTREGLDIYQTLLYKYGTCRILGTPQLTYYENPSGVVARGIKMAFSFKSGGRKCFVEDLVLYFNDNGKIYNVTFGLGDVAVHDILYKGAWPESARKAIMEFLENYRTAYALKRHDYISTIFDDDAVIIIANVASRQYTTTDGKVLNNPIIKKNRYTKDEYLRNLARCFRNNEYINIHFEDNDVVKLGKGGESYGIQISQDYYSSTYGDKGYLFLVVDINDPQKPIIRLRTWQPEKDPNFGIYGPSDFD